MAFVKNGDAEILEIIKEEDVKVDLTAEALENAKKEAKNVAKNGNKLESSKNSE